MKPSRETEKEAALQAAGNGRIDILKYFVEERKISDVVKSDCVATAAVYGQLDCIKYLVAKRRKTPLNHWQYIAGARYKEHTDCVNYLLEKGCPEPTDEEYAAFAEQRASARVSGGEQFPLRSSFDCITKRERHIFHQLERNFLNFNRSNFPQKTHMSSRIIDYSKWDTLNYSSSSSEEDDEKARATIAHLGDLLLSSSQRTSSSSPLWNGLVLHHKDIFVSHVLPKLNGTDRYFFSFVNTESRGVLEYAGVDVSGLGWAVHECSSISTLEWAWNHMLWGEKYEDGTVRDQAWFCEQVALTNKLEFLKWAREVKQCEWDEETIKGQQLKVISRC